MDEVHDAVRAKLNWPARLHASDFRNATYVGNALALLPDRHALLSMIGAQDPPKIPASRPGIVSGGKWSKEVVQEAKAARGPRRGSPEAALQETGNVWLGAVRRECVTQMKAWCARHVAYVILSHVSDDASIYPHDGIPGAYEMAFRPALGEAMDVLTTYAVAGEPLQISVHVADSHIGEQEVKGILRELLKPGLTEGSVRVRRFSDLHAGIGLTDVFLHWARDMTSPVTDPTHGVKSCVRAATQAVAPFADSRERLLAECRRHHRGLP